jgi:DNA-binding transcriptional LysR family regulator
VNLDALDLKRLRAFQLVARQGNLRLAASMLNQSIPAISGKLRKLEEDLGVALFDRQPNRLVLTATGARFLQQVDAVFRQAEQAVRSLASAPEAPRLAVTVGSDYIEYFADRIHRFLEANPATRFTLRTEKSADALVALEKGEVDLSIGTFPPLPKTLRRVVLAETTMALTFDPAASPPARVRDRLDFARQRVMVPPASSQARKLLERHLGDRLATAESVIEVPTCAAAVDFVRMGVGIALVHAQCLEAIRPDHLHSIDLGSAPTPRSPQLRAPSCPACATAMWAVLSRRPCCPATSPRCHHRQTARRR